MSSGDAIEQLSTEFCRETWVLLSEFMVNHEQLIDEYQKLLNSQQNLVDSNKDFLEKLKTYKNKYKSYFDNQEQAQVDESHTSYSNSTIEIIPGVNISTVQRLEYSSSSNDDSILSERTLKMPPNVTLKDVKVTLTKLSQLEIEKYLTKKRDVPEKFDENEDTENASSVKSTKSIKKSRTGDFKLDKLFRSQNPNVKRASNSSRKSFLSVKNV